MQRRIGPLALASGTPRFATLLRRPARPLDTILPKVVTCACTSHGGEPHPVHWLHRTVG